MQKPFGKMNLPECFDLFLKHKSFGGGYEKKKFAEQKKLFNGFLCR